MQLVYPVDEATAGGLQALLSPAAGTNVQGFTNGLLGTLNASTLQVELLPVRDLKDIRSLDQTITNTFEIGYKGGH